MKRIYEVKTKDAIPHMVENKLKTFVVKGLGYIVVKDETMLKNIVAKELLEQVS